MTATMVGIAGPFSYRGTKLDEEMKNHSTVDNTTVAHHAPLPQAGMTVACDVC